MSINCLECLNAKTCPILSFILANNEKATLSVMHCVDFKTLQTADNKLQNNPKCNLADRIASIKKLEQEVRETEEQNDKSICQNCQKEFLTDEMTYSLMSNRLLCEECYDKEGEDEA